MAAAARGTALTVFAILFAVLAGSNLLKPFQILGPQTGFVLFGERLEGAANAVAGPIFGLFLLAYAIGIWGMKRWALPLAWLYAAYVVVNLVLFRFRTETPPGVGYMIFGLVYMLVAIGVSGGAAWLLSRRKAELA
jgi:di/tricarboxylate transporter